MICGYCGRRGCRAEYVAGDPSVREFIEDCRNAARDARLRAQAENRAIAGHAKELIPWLPPGWGCRKRPTLRTNKHISKIWARESGGLTAWVERSSMWSVVNKRGIPIRGGWNQDGVLSAVFEADQALESELSKIKNGEHPWGSDNERRG